MPNFLIRDVPDETATALKKLAAKSGRSVQQELLIAVERYVRQASVDPLEAADRIRERLAKRGYSFEDSTALIREDRDR